MFEHYTSRSAPSRYQFLCGLWSVVVPKVLASILGVDVCTVWYQSTCYKHNFSLVLVLYNLYTLSRVHQLCKMLACFAGYSPTRGVLERVAVPTLQFARCCTVTYSIYITTNNQPMVSFLLYGPIPLFVFLSQTHTTFRERHGFSLCPLILSLFMKLLRYSTKGFAFF